MLFYPLTLDYIRYLNDPNGYRLNYDQWKERKKRLEKEKSNKRETRKDLFNS